jgi:hypothetical protein
MKSIKETRELVRALAAVAVRLIDDLKDGRISISEGIGFLSDFGVIREGVQGLAAIPGELADLSEEEREMLLADIGAALTGAGLSHRVADAAEKILRWAYGTVRTLVDLRQAPPSAEAA